MIPWNAHRLLVWLFRPFFVLVLLLSFAWGQAARPDSAQKPGGETAAPKAETRISPQEAQELFRSVDEILQFASRDTGLPIKQTVKRQLTSRDAVTAFLQKSLSEDKDAKRLQRSELVLKKFGLLPRDFDFQKFLIALLREQVAGYYDPRTKTVNLLDWISAPQQRPVMAHELTHALQDQSFNLKKWMKTADIDNARRPTSGDIQNDELASSRQAVVEGQATAVLADYMLAPMGRSLLDSPEIVAALRDGMLNGGDESVELRRAPEFIRESLTFPYRYGLDFVIACLKSGGKQHAFAGMFANPPTSTRQIMEPQTYLSGEHIDPMPVPDFKEVFRNYERFDIGAMGEFDVAVLLQQYAGNEVSHRLYPHWRGGYYYAGRPKGNPTAPLVLLYTSRWSDPEAAATFAAVYAKDLAKRYRKAQSADGTRTEDLETLTGRHSWTTEEGTVLIEVKDSTVLITEGLDEATTAALEKSILPASIN